MNPIIAWLRRLWDQHGPARRLIEVDSDVLPNPLPIRNLVLLRDDGDDLSVGMRCPCGCGATIELMVIPEAKPQWSFSTDAQGRPTLHPSVWRNTGCRSHFWVRTGRIHWCE
ncbi:DUF6527 family protein [Stappia sp. ES.058]|uniref:DUF6527 family protein n=1 Tax=Stappia sp. ES.058 TaxID=1881061 RepID=UPI00087A3F8A|nr:DUF6527 family protein [Stappia sp. ES.058]SDU08662.1 hypothetical protein SAMN05428979_1543 [Stappia sp. ES.058]